MKSFWLSLQATLTLLVLFPLHLQSQSGRTYRFESERDSPALKALVKTPAKTADALISIVSDLSRSATNNGEGDNNISNGKLGIAFVSDRFYGDISIAAFANNRELVAQNVADTAFFYNNLLLAQNRNSGLSELSLSFGTNGFLQFLPSPKWKPAKWFYRNFGLYMELRSSNQVWVKENQSTDVLLNAFSAVGTLQVFDYIIESPSWSSFQLLAFTGFTTRRLGGNYALNSAKEIRQFFLGTEEYVFNGWEYGVKMELGPFYGKATFTEFKLDDDIPGFSGPQLAITLGAVINLDLVGLTRQ
ncbi:MAG: hypothetical protein KF734_21200 [Saprospiraceae bacterium]|nr:hypothetical protein [Saprospiraceae bacterium]